MILSKHRLFMLAFLLCGCEAKNLYVAHETVIGINAKLSDTRQQGRLVVGYDRDFATIIPQSVQATDRNGNPIPGKLDAMATVGCNKVEVNGVQLTQYSDFIVTGEAAVELAGKLSSSTTVFDCDVKDGLSGSGAG